ncbi:unnamed protein product [Peronospora belbahrii]|uniref:Large ribosomal subunit protein bL34m n=1 Tax=Peronospora belbahrii TaxID=622444 RepID=A0AAU9L5R0_9STRA|nr:unnamed protein product [Peronospora belbahrii]CAH0519361.1 unnamed protein product [Peronospora belbahrii]
MAALVMKSVCMSLRMRPGVISSIRSLSTFTTFNAQPHPSLLLPLLPPTNYKLNAVQQSLVFETGINYVEMDDSQLPLNQIEELKCPPTESFNNEPLQAIKRTYQPSVLRRKRKHGFRTRRVSISGRKVLKRRFNKGRWRMSL